MKLCLEALGWWVLLASVITGFGLALRRAMGLRLRNGGDALTAFWVGWALLIGFLQIWHLVRRVDPATLAAAVTLGAAGLAWNGRDLAMVGRKCWPGGWACAAFILAAGFWTALRASGPILNYDTGLYHLAAVRWITTYPIVPGLGNLHTRLAYNNSSFLYSALLDEWPWRHQACHLGNGLLGWMLLVQGIVSLQSLARRSGERSRHLFYGLLLPPILAHINGLLIPDAYYISSMSPDFVVFALGIVVSGELLRLLGSARRATAETDYGLVSVALLAAAGTSVKFSFLVFAVVSGAVAWFAWVRRPREEADASGRRRATLWAGAAAAAILLPWMVRGIILSGYPAFPSSFGGLPVSWRVPRVLVDGEMNWICGWAKKTGVFWWETVGNWDWLPGWLERLPRAFWQPFLIAIFALAYLSGVRRGPMPGGRLRSWAILLPGAASLAFWFLMAPDPRFAGAAAWILAAGATVLASGQTRRMDYLLCFAFFVFVAPFNGIGDIMPHSANGAFLPLPGVRSAEKVTASGLKVRTPQEGDRCWRMLLPCTPNFRRDLRLRREGHLSSGFTVDDPDLYFDYNLPNPPNYTLSPGLSLKQLSGWDAYDSTTQSQGMKSPARLLIYANRRGTYQFSFSPGAVKTGADPYEGEARLRIQAGDRAPVVAPVVAGARAELTTELRSGFNLVTVELASDAERPLSAVLNQTTIAAITKP